MISSDDQIVDAEFETLGPTPKAKGNAVRSTDAPPRQGLGVFARADRQAAPRKPMPLPVFAAIATLSACVSFYFAGGHVLFPSARTVPAPVAQPATAAGAIVLEQVSTRVDTSGSRTVFVIRATIANTAQAAAIVPPVTITFDRPDGSGSTTHTIVRGEWLESGERMAFTSRIPAGEYAGIEPRVALAPASN